MRYDEDAGAILESVLYKYKGYHYTKTPRLACRKILQMHCAPVGLIRLKPSKSKIRNDLSDSCLPVSLVLKIAPRIQTYGSTHAIS